MVTHVNLNDQTLEGFDVPALRLRAVQYHPEASPGPHDSHGLFRDFLELMNEAGGQGPDRASRETSASEPSAVAALPPTGDLEGES